MTKSPPRRRFSFTSLNPGDWVFLGKHKDGVKLFSINEYEEIGYMLLIGKDGMPHMLSINGGALSYTWDGDTEEPTIKEEIKDIGKFVRGEIHEV